MNALEAYTALQMLMNIGAAVVAACLAHLIVAPIRRRIAAAGDRFWDAADRRRAARRR